LQKCRKEEGGAAVSVVEGEGDYCSSAQGMPTRVRRKVGPGSGFGKLCWVFHGGLLLGRGMGFG